MKSNCKTCGKEFAYFPSNRSGKYCSLKCCSINQEYRRVQAEKHTGKIWGEESRIKMSKSRVGVKKSNATKLNMSNAQKGRKTPWSTGENSHWWKGGITVKQKGERASREYRLWRKHILKRDNYTCKKCGEVGNVVDHIIPFAFMLRESEIIGNKKGLYDYDNGETLCNLCHIKTPTYCQKTERQVEFSIVATLERLWKQNPEGHKEFSTYYQQKMGAIIDHLKEKIND